MFAAASVLSLVLCTSVTCLLARQGRVIGGQREIFSVYLKSRHARGTLRADAERLVLCAPPPAAPLSLWINQLPSDADPRPPATLLMVMRNEDFIWEIDQWKDDRQLRITPRARPKAETVRRYNRLNFTDEGLVIPGLLEALEDPRRAVAAHAVLMTLLATRATAPETELGTLPGKPAGPFTFEYDGLKVNCPSLGKPSLCSDNPDLTARVRVGPRIGPVPLVAPERRTSRSRRGQARASRGGAPRQDQG